MNKITGLFLLLVIVAGCSLQNVESGDPVTITIGLNASGAKAPSADVTWTAFSASGPDMETVTLDAAALSAASLVGYAAVTVPPGASRTFSLACTTGSVDYAGSVTQTIEADTTPAVTIPMSLSRSNILVPDRYNYRLVQFNDMTGAGWIEEGGMETGETTFNEGNRPEQVGYDNWGNIYVLTYGQSGYVIYRTDVLRGDGLTEWQEPYAGPFDYLPNRMYVEKNTGYVYIYSTYNQSTQSGGDFLIPIAPGGVTGTAYDLAAGLVNINEDDSFYGIDSLASAGNGSVIAFYSYMDGATSAAIAAAQTLAYSGGADGTWTKTGTTWESEEFYYLLGGQYSFIKITGNNLYILMLGYWNDVPELRSIQFDFDGTSVSEPVTHSRTPIYEYIYLDHFDNGTDAVYFYASIYDADLRADSNVILEFTDASFSDAEDPAEFGTTGNGTGQFNYAPQ